ncbi:MAG: radical SAM protein [Acidobacteriia bacterium]|nr:radical SAM protein [Terriglobia bacterium]
MRKLHIGIIDIVSKGPTRALYARVMNPNLASIMPQVIAVWCREQGHDVTFLCYTGFEDLIGELPSNIDLIFIGAFTEAAHTAYALSNLFRSRGAVTALGGPHARCYPEDALRYFDYVLGFTDRETLRGVLSDCSPHRPAGMRVAAAQQPKTLPGVRQRWPFIEPTLRKAPLLKMVPTLGSLGCPYTCAFCIDAAVPYQTMDFDGVQEDLSFLLTKFRRPRVGWHDPNFGVRFNEFLDVIERAAPPGRIDFIAESSLSLLSEPHLKRLKRCGFKALLPGIESWFDLGNKSKTGAQLGMDKVRQVADHVNLILGYIPYVQANFVLGLDTDEGPEPFELTKRFLDLAPGAFPGYSLLTAFGRAAQLNLDYQRAHRVLPFPFHFLNNNQAMNVRPRNYSWRGFYDRVIDLTAYSFSVKANARRFRATAGLTARAMNVVRAVSTEGFGRLNYYKDIRRRLDKDPQFRPYFEQETAELPRFYIDLVRKDLGPLFQWLPEGALYHNPNAYWQSQGCGDVGSMRPSPNRVTLEK